VTHTHTTGGELLTHAPGDRGSERGGITGGGGGGGSLNHPLRDHADGGEVAAGGRGGDKRDELVEGVAAIYSSISSRGSDSDRGVLGTLF
jgi:hypothetical protein